MPSNGPWFHPCGPPRLAPATTPTNVLAVVEETSGTPLPFLRAALAYWGDFPEEVDAFLDRARAEAAQARASWQRQQELLGR